MRRKESRMCIITVCEPCWYNVHYFRGQGPKIDTRNFTVLVKNSISFPQMKQNYHVWVCHHHTCSVIFSHVHSFSFSFIVPVKLFHVCSLSLSLSQSQYTTWSNSRFSKELYIQQSEGRSCPIFSLGQIVGMINQSESFYDDLATLTCIKYTAFLSWEREKGSNMRS